MPKGGRLLEPRRRTQLTKSIHNALAALLLIMMIALACDENAGNAPAEENTQKKDSTATEQSSDEPGAVDLDLGQDEPEEEVAELVETPEPTPAPPERIRFRRGESQGRINIALGPGESKRYVVGVAGTQYFHIGMDSSRPAIRVLSRNMLVETDEGDTFVDGVTARNGDIVFEISNPTGSPVRTFALVTIQHREPMDH